MHDLGTKQKDDTRLPDFTSITTTMMPSAVPCCGLANPPSSLMIKLYYCKAQLDEHHFLCQSAATLDISMCAMPVGCQRLNKTGNCAHSTWRLAFELAHHLAAMMRASEPPLIHRPRLAPLCLRPLIFSWRRDPS